MVDVLCLEDRIRISDIGSGPTRRALLGLEPGSRIWLTIDDVPMLFERMVDRSGESVRAIAPAAESVELWRRTVQGRLSIDLDVDFIERPADAGHGADRW